ncbi:MAG TPA: pyruvate:ferredoxin (flavodoxin) oxidoreductase [Brevefilum sp.]|nr:pyruvate:ferredoxin (flavodoxin) oxidoreductase [Brevefilum sp.]HOR18700.1 pyruvate:ferredoxin (flavodoxin) oxidoreductase [Brevefilum sp.]HPL68601.1 pyruvate:ferredoxin (flavodoxin) oxidoreductase [Brevefilum sp.]
MTRQMVMTDANEATAWVAYRLNEVIAIYPITPSSGMGEFADEWAAEGIKNIWGTVPDVTEMQSEGGAAGAVHGALQAGGLTTTFTASQGLLLMIPNMYKIAGELTSTVFNVSARSIAAQALSIFGDHSDITAVRATGFALLASDSVQQSQDMALIAQAATLRSRVPFLHFFDGFRSSHEINKIERLDEDDLRALIDDELVAQHRGRALTPDRPVLRGTAQNPDVFFQGRETVNPFYEKTPDIVQEVMDQFAERVGRSYHLFDYVGSPDAEKVVVVMASGVETAQETAKALIDAGEKVGVIAVRLYRPFSTKHLMQALPSTVKVIAVLDRTKEPGAGGEPLYLDVVNAVKEGFDLGLAPFETLPRVIGGRYGLSSKEFTPAMVKGIFDEMDQETPKNHFTVGIIDDVSHTNLDWDPTYEILKRDVIQAMFFGLGADGTVSANKNSIKIIGEETDNFAQGYFQYDSKKSGAVTVSHLRFGPEPIRAPYQIAENEASFVACHQFSFLEKYDMLKYARPKGIFLLNSLFGPDEIWDQLPAGVQGALIKKDLQFYIIDAYEVANKTNMGQRINTIMQTCFFAISGILPREQAIAHIKKSIEETYGKRGEAVIKQNFLAVDSALEHMYKVEIPDKVTSTIPMKPPVPAEAPEYVREVLGKIIDRDGDNVRVSEMPVDGTFPTATTQWEKRNVALEIPVWEPDLCIQCGKCAFVCPHAAIRTKVYQDSYLAESPETFKHTNAKFREFRDGWAFTVQVAPEDCTGCGLCVENCPAKDKENPSRKAINMAPQPPIREQEAENWTFFSSIPYPDRKSFSPHTVKNSQLLEPLFEFSGACAGCGETPYLRLVTQLFGDRMVVANATGCSSIYGANLPTTPYAVNADGRGPAWSNSLFEDNAEFGLGMRLTIDKFIEYGHELLERLSDQVGRDLADAIINASQKTEEELEAQRAHVEQLKGILEKLDLPEARNLLTIADYLVRKSVWIIGGDGWAYDIGYGGLDHVLASGRDVNILVLDTEVYSNTGGQSSKATPRAAVAKFAANGKNLPKKDLGMMAMSYGYAYVARIAMGANDRQTLQALREAEAYPGPSLIIAYSHCIAHGINMRLGLQQQDLAVKSGVWPIYRYNPELGAQGENPLTIDAKEPTIPVEDYAYNETRYRMLLQSNEARAEQLMVNAKQDAASRWTLYQQMADMHYKKPDAETEE